jgi:hypothetical protein
LLDALYKKKLRTRKDDFKFPRGHMNFHGFSVVSDPGATISTGAIDPEETVSAGSLTPPKPFSGVVDPAELF